jgi:hypothetical protein
VFSVVNCRVTQSILAATLVRSPRNTQIQALWTPDRRHK